MCDAKLRFSCCICTALCADLFRQISEWQELLPDKPGIASQRLYEKRVLQGIWHTLKVMKMANSLYIDPIRYDGGRTCGFCQTATAGKLEMLKWNIERIQDTLRHQSLSKGVLDKFMELKSIIRTWNVNLFTPTITETCYSNPPYSDECPGLCQCITTNAKIILLDNKQCGSNTSCEQRFWNAVLTQTSYTKKQKERFRAERILRIDQLLQYAS